MKVVGFLLVLIGALALVSCATSDGNATSVDTLSGYESWVKVNPETITGDATGTLGRNVHQGSTGFRDVYVNTSGAAVANGDSSGPFPVGSILVKNSFKDDGGQMGDLADITVMIKREAGYDPDNGDWEYMMLSDTMQVRAQGAINNCIACHTAAAANDYAFLNYR